MIDIKKHLEVNSESEEGAVFASSQGLFGGQPTDVVDTTGEYNIIDDEDMSSEGVIVPIIISFMTILLPLLLSSLIIMENDRIQNLKTDKDKNYKKESRDKIIKFLKQNKNIQSQFKDLYLEMKKIRDILVLLEQGDEFKNKLLIFVSKKFNLEKDSLSYLIDTGRHSPKLYNNKNNEFNDITNFLKDLIKNYMNTNKFNKEKIIIAETNIQCLSKTDKLEDISASNYNIIKNFIIKEIKSMNNSLDIQARRQEWIFLFLYDIENSSIKKILDSILKELKAQK